VFGFVASVNLRNIRSLRFCQSETVAEQLGLKACMEHLAPWAIRRPTPSTFLSHAGTRSCNNFKLFTKCFAVLIKHQRLRLETIATKHCGGFVNRSNYS